MSDYTLETELVRRDYCLEYGSYYPERAREFDRWLTEHDRQVAERAWDEGYDAGETDGFLTVATSDEVIEFGGNPYREVGK